jgi:MOSC domain-containing protein
MVFGCEVEAANSRRREISMPTIGRVAEIWRYPFKSMAGQRLERAEMDSHGIAGDRGWAVRDESAGEIRGAKKLPGLLKCRAAYVSEPRPGGPIPDVAITLPDGGSMRASDRDAAARLSALLGKSVTLWPLQPRDATDHYLHGKPDNPDVLAEIRQTFGLKDEDPLPNLLPFIEIGLDKFATPPGSYFDAFPIHVLTTATLAHLGAINSGARWDVRRFRPNLLLDLGADRSGLVERDWLGKTLRIGAAELSFVAACPRCVMTTLPQDDLLKDPSILRTIVTGAASNVGVYASFAGTSAVSVAEGDPVEMA